MPAILIILALVCGFGAYDFARRAETADGLVPVAIFAALTLLLLVAAFFVGALEAMG